MPETLYGDVSELARLTKLRRQLELPAYIFERHAPPGCRGDCSAPHSIGDLGLTCCHFWLGFTRYAETRQLERCLRDKVERGRAAVREEEATRVA